MQVIIENVSRRPVIIELNSREVVRLSPGEMTTVGAVEVTDNVQVDKLKKRQMIKTKKLETSKMQELTSAVESETRGETLASGSEAQDEAAPSRSRRGEKRS